ncbi:unnamed protein product [Darwinula stevensoni]|uniref:Polyglutamine-binding protein 1 n=1 Tax=Darwinula stevensoni TaxID=69355 RepID=A0A7R8XEW0_9CRUS|nr:unnamed protein product [Darwinula stevensoni]CAG0894634.1 unnamed protein product [Darwinula stevensoni]
MPLPPALAARLAKRGLIRKTDPDEEIIAEDYDDSDGKKDADRDNQAGECPNCPNKYNIYHQCSKFCWNTWEAARKPNPDDEKRRIHMLLKYPLPPGWREALDPGTGRFYYWNVDNGYVSWLSPMHPRAVIGPCASRIRSELPPSYKNEPQNEQGVAQEAMEQGSDYDSDEDERRSRKKDRGASRRDRDRDRDRDRERDRDRDRGRRGRAKPDELDPMDPAAYSEAPRGTWSTGLQRRNEAKTGADETASGPLYQMRPYPSPGAVLRANAEARRK